MNRADALHSTQQMHLLIEYDRYDMVHTPFSHSVVCMKNRIDVFNLKFVARSNWHLSMCSKFRFLYHRVFIVNPTNFMCHRIIDNNNIAFIDDENLPKEWYP